MMDNVSNRDQCVLFIDDEQSVLDGLRRALHRAPFQKLFAQSAFQALELVDSTPIDIVVADEQMPGMTGSEFLSIVRTRHPEIIRIILSGHASMERVIEAINAGQIHRFLVKPMDSDLLLEILQQYLSNLRLLATKKGLLNRTDTLGRWEWDILGGTCQWSRGFERLMHFTPATSEGDFTELFGSVHPEDRATLVRAIHDCKDSGQTREAEHRIILHDGSVRWIAQYVDVFRDADRTWRLIGMLRDITDQKEKEFLQTERLFILQKTLDKTVEALARMTEIRDPYTAGHQARVASLAVRIGKSLDLDAQRLLGLETAAKLHDIGKIYIPSEFLAKPGTLREVEMNLMKCHPEIGYQIVRDIPFAMPVADMVLQHHERLDGSGYPHGLKKEEIMLEARILGVADVFEAMSSHRPYRPGLGQKTSLDELLGKKGTAFDASAVEALADILEKEPDLLEDLQRHFP
jgi:PAS domain S-box-containing protein